MIPKNDKSKYLRRISSVFKDIREGKDYKDRILFEDKVAHTILFESMDLENHTIDILPINKITNSHEKNKPITIRFSENLSRNNVIFLLLNLDFLYVDRSNRKYSFFTDYLQRGFNFYHRKIDENENELNILLTMNYCFHLSSVTPKYCPPNLTYEQFIEFYGFIESHFLGASRF